MGYELDGQVSILGIGKVFASISHPPDQLWSPPKWVPELKRPESEVDNLLPSSAEVKKGGAISPLPHMSSRCGA
jgi:hypothetical protein